MFVPSVAMWAEVGSEDGCWCVTSHGNSTAAVADHVSTGECGSSGGAVCTVGIPTVRSVEPAAATGRPGHAAIATAMHTAMQTRDGRNRCDHPAPPLGPAADKLLLMN